jgi:thiol-disulfide isomerase/thioredoxin
MPGCGACEEYLPRFQQLAGPYRREIPIGIYNVQDGRGAHFGDKMGVKATPTTIVMDKHGRLKRFVGALGNAAIRELLKHAAADR